MPRSISLLPFLLCFTLNCYSDEIPDSIPTMSFQLTDAVTAAPVQMAHVENQRRHLGVIADMLGFFELPFTQGDTLLISAIGYHDMLVPSFGQLVPDSLYILRMTPRVYELSEVVVTRFGSYQRFIREAAMMKLPKSEKEVFQENIQAYFNRKISEMDFMKLPSPQAGPSLSMDWLAAQQQLVEQHRREEERWGIITRKFSAGIVMELTGLTCTEAVKFMEYCQFTEAFLLTASEYEVKERVLAKYKVFKKTGESSE